MALFYIVPFGEPLDVTRHAEFETATAAKQHAQASHDRNGNHYNVVKVESVWVTQTLAQALLAELAGKEK